MLKPFLSAALASLAALLPGPGAKAALVTSSSQPAVFSFDLSSLGDTDFVNVEWCAVSASFPCNNTAPTAPDETVEAGGGFGVAFGTTPGGSELASFTWTASATTDNVILNIASPSFLGAPVSAPAALAELFVSFSFVGDNFAARQAWLRYADGAGTIRIEGTLVTPQIPLPAGAPLVLTGLAGLFAARRRLAAPAA